MISANKRTPGNKGRKGTSLVGLHCLGKAWRIGVFRLFLEADFVFISLTERIFVFCLLGGSRIFRIFYDVFQRIFESFVSRADSEITA